MKIINDKLRKDFKTPGRCECCGTYCHDGLDPAHVRSRGSGGSDLRCNLVSLRRLCHSSSHAGHEPCTEALLGIVSRREGFSEDAIKEVWAWVSRLDKDSSRRRIELALGELGDEARTLARRELKEAKVL